MKYNARKLLPKSSVLAMVSLAMVIPNFAAAQDVVYKQRTVVDFGDDTIDGSLSKPDSGFIDAQKNRQHKLLIKVRKSFRAEILRSVRGL